MGEAGLSELAGVVGAAGVVLALLAGRRMTLLGGFGLIALAEVLLADPGRVSPALAAAALAGVVVLAAAATVFVRYPALVVPALLLAAPFRLPFDFDREHRFLFALAEGGRLGRLVPLYVALVARPRQRREPPRVLSPPVRRARGRRRARGARALAAEGARLDLDRPRVP